jgi:hypothetical protein
MRTDGTVRDVSEDPTGSGSPWDGWWKRVIGPVYDADGLRRAFGFSAGLLEEMAESKVILELRTSDGETVFPAYCFSETGEPLPRLPEVVSRLMAREFSDPWSVAIWLNDQAEEWKGRSAVELLRTEEWADEVVAQAGEHGRSPLGARAKQAEQMAIARPILDRFVELVADLPVDVAEGTLFVTRETEVPYGVFAMSIRGSEDGLRAVRFGLDGDLEELAEGLAAVVTVELSSL